MLGELFGSNLRAKVIGWLFTHPDEGFFIRQLESLLGADSTNLSRELGRLARLGVLTCRTRGRQRYYQANPDSPIFGELKGIAVKTAGLADVLRELLAPLGDKVALAFLYGSQAAGTADAASDVDVMVVGKARFADVVAALQPAQDRLGREVNPTVYSVSEFRAKLARRHPFVTAAASGPKIFLKGNDSDLAKLAKERLAG